MWIVYEFEMSCFGGETPKTQSNISPKCCWYTVYSELYHIFRITVADGQWGAKCQVLKWKNHLFPLELPLSLINFFVKYMPWTKITKLRGNMLHEFCCVTLCCGRALTVVVLRRAFNPAEAEMGLVSSVWGPSWKTALLSVKFPSLNTG